MNQRRAGTSAKAKQTKRGTNRFALDPYFAGLIFAAVGLGTLKLGTSPRLAILWSTLLGLWIAYREGQPMRLEYRVADIGRGAGIGLLVGLPLVLVTFRGLVAAIPILYVSTQSSSVLGASGTMIFVSLVLLAPLAEELFFRDVVQRERGFWIAITLYAAAGVIFYLPTAGEFPMVLGAVSGATAVLGILYAFLYERYGLTIALACHTAVNTALIFVPAIVAHLGLFAS